MVGRQGRPSKKLPAQSAKLRVKTSRCSRPGSILVIDAVLRKAYIMKDQQPILCFHAVQDIQAPYHDEPSTSYSWMQDGTAQGDTAQGRILRSIAKAGREILLTRFWSHLRASLKAAQQQFDGHLEENEGLQHSSPWTWDAVQELVVYGLGTLETGSIDIISFISCSFLELETTPICV